MKRTVLGLVLTSLGGGRWASPYPGRFQVERDDEFITECEGAHPTPDGGYHEDPQEHTYTRWGVWDNERGDFASNTSPGDFATFKEAAEWLATHIEELS